MRQSAARGLLALVEDMFALTQCWFTRAHKPDHAGRRDAKGVYHGACRYCDRPIISWDRQAWHLAEGFNLMQVYQDAQTPFLYLVDTRDDFVVARFPVDHLQSEDEISAFAQKIQQENNVGDPDSFLILRDSRKPHRVWRGEGLPPPSDPLPEPEVSPAPVADTVVADAVPLFETGERYPSRGDDTDRITGLPGRSSFERVFDAEWQQARRDGTRLTIAFCDIDHLDRLNRACGLDAGDAAIRAIADLLAGVPDCRCHVSRNRGFEFVLLFAGQSSAQAQPLLDHVREQVAVQRLEPATDQPVSMSCGMAEVPGEGDPRVALRLADEALHRAKIAGRNCLVVEGAGA